MSTFDGGGTVFTVAQYAASMTPVQVTVGSGTRKKATLSATTSAAYYVGTSAAMTVNNSFFVPAGGVTTIDTAGPIWVLGLANFTMSVMETF